MIENQFAVNCMNDSGEFEDIVNRAPTNTANTAQYSLSKSAERIARAWLKNCSVIFVCLKRICHLVRTCLTVCCSLTCRAPRAHHLPDSPCLLPRHQNTHHNRDNTICSKYTQCIINLSQNDQSKSNVIKNHSVVKISRVAETGAPQLPQVMNTRSSRLSQGSKIILEIHVNYMMHRKIWRTRSPSSDHRRSEGIRAT